MSFAGCHAPVLFGTCLTLFQFWELCSYSPQRESGPEIAKTTHSALKATLAGKKALLSKKKPLSSSKLQFLPLKPWTGLKVYILKMVDPSLKNNGGLLSYIFLLDGSFKRYGTGFFPSQTFSIFNFLFQDKKIALKDILWRRKWLIDWLIDTKHLPSFYISTFCVAIVYHTLEDFFKLTLPLRALWTLDFWKELHCLETYT